ncbi:MAG TPA: hypothetical protein VET85_03700 [Stellaceae bacterium]|nr:hypothetical protein [Stellaceae bacterium]
MRTLELAGLVTFAATAAFAQPTAVPPQNNVTACLPMGAPSGSGLQVEVQDEFGPYRAGETVMVSDANGLPLASITCEGPWANFRLAPGTYRVFAFIGDTQSNELAVNVLPSGSQVTLKLQPPATEVPVPPALSEDSTRLPPPPPDLAADLAAPQ